MKSHIAIDPGKGGGMCWMQDGQVSAISMPPTHGDIVDALRAIGVNTRRLVIEKLPKFVGKAIPSSSAAVLFENYGVILGTAMALGYRVDKVDPVVWQKHFRIGTKRQCASNTEWKNKLKSKAQELFPDLTVTLRTADAILIYEYGRTVLYAE